MLHFWHPGSWLPGLTPRDPGDLGQNLGLKEQKMKLFVISFCRWQKASQSDPTDPFPKLGLHKHLVVPPHGRFQGETPGQDEANPIPCQKKRLEPTPWILWIQINPVFCKSERLWERFGCRRAGRNTVSSWRCALYAVTQNSGVLRSAWQSYTNPAIPILRE